MSDLEYDDEFHIMFAPNGDLGTVQGLREAEQELRITITEYFYEYIGNRNNSNTVRHLKLATRRAAEDADLVSSIQSIDVESQEGDTLRLRIEYNYSEEFEFEVI